MGLQLAQTVPEFKREMVKLSREGVTLEKKNAQFIWQKMFTSILSSLVLPRPLYWIIDALDESESPKALLDLLRDLPRFRTPIRIFIVSRRTEPLSLAFERLSVLIPVDVIQNDGQKAIKADIRTYVERGLQYMRGAEQLKSQVMESIVHRSDGNFLWVNLVLEEIIGCHTQQAIQETLEELPAEMGPLYQRMELTIAKNPRAADRRLAKTILTWVVGAHRPLTLQELSQALTPEFPEFLDFERTVLEVCGQFIVVDRSKHVAFVHKTARDYLTQTPNIQFFINEKDSHKELFGKTISFLLRPSLRSKLGQDQQAIRSAEPFLPYAAISFMYHLRQAGTSSESIMDKLTAFLRGPSVLTWVHSLGLFSQLEHLVTAARVLIWFSSLNGKLNLEKNPLLHRLQDLELFELWAIDLVKIVAKFGRHLLGDPTAIYKVIPPLCPQNSIISRQFKQSELSALSISGISNAVWNDCLATLSLQNGAKAWKITCAGRHIAVLSSTGSIVLWDSVNFEETCTMPHAEFVTQICFNTKCDQLVSYGFKTTKVWTVPSGRLVATIPNPRDCKALAITFTENNTKILIGSGDKMLRHFDINACEDGWRTQDPTLLEEDSAVEGGFITSPSFIAFNADATHVAIAYRGYPLSVWATKERRLIGRCRRTIESRNDHGRPSVSWMAVERVAWNPVAEPLVGLYKDGCVFKWNPISDENQEARTLADEIQVSPDGKLFVTSDSNGTVKIWDFAYFSVIYQLASENLVTALAFSPDCRRFYDLRGSSINAWEPNSVVRFLDNVETVSDTASDYQASGSTSQISEAWLVSIEPISALATAPGSQLYCASYENGKVDLFDNKDGKLLGLATFSTFSIVDHLTWGEDGRHVAAADLGGKFQVKRLKTAEQSTDKPQFEVQSLLEGKIKAVVGGIHQILLNRESTKLLMVSQNYGQIWSLETGELAFSGELEKGETRRWVNDPLQRAAIIGIGPEDLKIVDWENLKTSTSLAYHEDCLHSDSRSAFDTKNSVDIPERQPTRKTVIGFKENTYVEKAMFTQDDQHLLVQLSKTSLEGKDSKKLLIFEKSQLDPRNNPNDPSFLRPHDISGEVMKKIEVPLGILPGKKLVFLDKDLWMCTLKLSSSRQSNAVRRHYFMPRDWVTTDSLKQCCLLQDGTFLCPKDGEVAVIASGLGEASW